MRKFLVLLDREVKSFFYSPIAYVVMLFFLFLTGFVFYAGVSFLNQGPASYTVVEAFFNTVLFWIGFVLIFPLITMRLFSEEWKLGTIEPLMTAPVTDLQVVLAKFCGAMVFYIVLWLPSLLYFVIFRYITGAAAAQAMGAYWGAYLLVLLVGMFFISIGCLASALTQNQIIAAVVSLCTIIMVFFAGLLQFIILQITPFMRDVFGYFSAIEHMREFSKGMIDSRPIIFYLSMTALVLVITYQVFQARRWRV